MRRETDWARGIISAAVVLIFGFAYAQNPGDEMMKGALIAAFAGVANYWLGSSKGSDDKTQMLSNDRGAREVEVVNSPSEPVHTAPVAGGPARNQDDSNPPGARNQDDSTPVIEE